MYRKHISFSHFFVYFEIHFKIYLNIYENRGFLQVYVAVTPKIIIISKKRGNELKNF